MTSVILPSLFILQLDHNLWNYSSDYEIQFPCKQKNGAIVDCKSDPITCYPAVPAILETLNKTDMKIAIIESVKDKTSVMELVKMFGWDKYASFIEIGPDNELEKFKRLREKSGIPYREMLFLYMRYFSEIPVLEQMGVFLRRANYRDGIMMKDLDKALKKYDLKKQLKKS